ncbi:hypothetical protein [Sphingomonas hengshuiensis]|uniref:hypothetical protein n=1 Tax=Sphingomonas hengshuiensis TaxID=1609977 RepID=UPI0005C9CE81|nr:hypothetical protein [Sphingomonas hengshuiensis]
MTTGQPDDPIPPQPQPSLVQRATHAGRARIAAAPMGDWRLGVAVAALLALGPALTIGGAAWLRADALAEATRLRASAAPHAAEVQARAEARAALAPVLDRPTLGTTIEVLARGMPADAQLVRVERTAQGALEIDASAPDPDRLRAALRREPALAGLRDVSQRRGDGAMIASFRSVGE